ncbi:MAG: hypothetical protein WC515_00835 [Candidatus Omnitrophota bacterium]
MSKTIESVRRFPAKDDILHDHIANTYFYQKTRKKKAKPLHKSIKINAGAAAFFIAVAFLIAASPSIYNIYLESLKKKIMASDQIKIVDGGRLDKLALKNFSFRGYARGKSGFAGTYLLLNNAKKYNWADLSADFKFPLDLSKRVVSVTIRGSTGGEKVTLVLRDSASRSSRANDIYLTPDWKTVAIPVSIFSGQIDTSSVTHMRIEYGHIGESAKEMDIPIEVKIYVKDLSILKEG